MAIELKSDGGRYPYQLAPYQPAEIRASLQIEGDQVRIRIDDLRNSDRWEELDGTLRACPNCTLVIARTRMYAVFEKSPTAVRKNGKGRPKSPCASEGPAEKPSVTSRANQPCDKWLPPPGLNTLLFIRHPCRNSVRQKHASQRNCDSRHKNEPILQISKDTNGRHRH